MMLNHFIKLFSFCILVIFTQFSNAQFGVNAVKVKSVTKTTTACFDRQLKLEDYKKLKKMTTYFVCPKNMADELESLQTLFDEAWNYNDILVITQDDIQVHLREKDAAFFTLGIATLDGRIREVYYELWSVKDPNKDYTTDNLHQYARFNVYYLCSYEASNKELNNNELFAYLYSEAEMRNIKPGIVANYLKFLESYLTEEKYMYCHSSIAETEKLKTLKEDTLFITDNIKLKFETKISKMGCEKEEEQEIDKLMAKYPFPYRFISYDDLNDKILSGKNFYYALCLKSQPVAKHISIFNSKTGNCIYNDTDASISFKTGDLKNIADQINK